MSLRTEEGDVKRWHSPCVRDLYARVGECLLSAKSSRAIIRQIRSISHSSVPNEHRNPVTHFLGRRTSRSGTSRSSPEPHCRHRHPGSGLRSSVSPLAPPLKPLCMLNPTNSQCKTTTLSTEVPASSSALHPQACLLFSPLAFKSNN